MNTSRPFNILLTSAGRRVQLVRFFQRALARSGLSSKVFVSEANPEWSAAARVADGSIHVPPVQAPEYPASLMQAVKSAGIGLIVPTIDTELAVLSNLRDQLSELGVSVVISDAELITISRDKRRSALWFESLGFVTPRLMRPDELTFPCFVKPFNGSLSRGAQALHSSEMLSPALLADESLLFMEYFSPAEFREFTVDAYYTRDGELACLVPRRRVEIRGGEISKGVALKGTTYHFLREKLRRIEGARGCLTFQFFTSMSEDRWIAIELNARFGGGYPLSHAAGADYPAWLVSEYLLGHPVSWFDDWHDRTAMVRYDQDITFTMPE